jgi:hypothetical protein
VTADVGGGCGFGIGFLVFAAAALFAVTSWPAYFLTFLRVSEGTIVRVRSAVVRTSLVLAIAATAAVLVLVFLGC